MSLRERVKRIPILGPAMHRAYLRRYYHEEEIFKIKSGPLAGYKWQRFMRTFNDKYVAGDYERFIQEALVAHLRRGMTFYDVGANAGFFSLLGASLVGDQGKVIAFEPHPDTAQQLDAQIRLNDISNVSITVAAVADRIGVASFDDEGPSVMASIIEPLARKRAIQVLITTLDHQSKVFGEPNVIKIDVEGGEMKVLHGSARLLKDGRPIFLVELHSEAIAVEYYKFMSRVGYRTESIEGERFVLSIPE